MASNEELKIAIIATAKVDAIKRARKELNKLGGVAAVKAQKELNKLNRSIKSLQGPTRKSSILFSRFTQGIAAGNLIAIGTTKALAGLKNILSEIGETILVAAQVEELALVYEFVGEKAGFSTEQLEGFRQQLIKNGIAQKEANQALLRGLQAEINLADVVKLSRVARDAAIPGLTDTSDALVRIVDSLAKLLPRELKELGIIINLNQVYKKFSKTLGKNATDLTETEKKTAFLNEILKKGEILSGAYEKAMESASKQLRSLKRHTQNARVEMGQQFTPLLMLAVKAQELFFKITAKVGKLLQQEDLFNDEGIKNIIGKMQEWIDKSASLASIIFGAGKVILNTFSAIKNGIEIVLAPLSGFIKGTANLMAGDLTAAAINYTLAQAAMNDQIKDLTIDLLDLNDGMIMIKQGFAGMAAGAETATISTDNLNDTLDGTDDAFKRIQFTAREYFDNVMSWTFDAQRAAKESAQEGTKGFNDLQSAANSFFNLLNSKGEFSMHKFLSFALQIAALFSTGGAAGAGGGLGLFGSLVGGGGGGIGGIGIGSVLPSGVSGNGGVNIQGNLTIVTQAGSPQAVAREIENLSSRNLTTINTTQPRITR